MLNSRCFVALGLLVTLVAPAFAAMPDNMRVLVTRAQVRGNTTGAIGGFGYQASTGDFYTAQFGSGSSIRYWLAPADQAYVTESDLNRIARSPNVPAGLTYSTWAGAINPSCLLPNPATVTYNGVTYPPGTLCVLTSNGTTVSISGTVRWDYTKRLLTYDLRKIGAATSALPDYATAQDGNGGTIGALGIADWNDVFTSLVNKQEMADAIGVSGNSASDNLGRQCAWSSDAQAVYFLDSSVTFGGIWKKDMVGGSLVRILNETGASRPNTEPAVIPTTVRDLTGGTKTGDQIIFEGGGTVSGNAGGMNWVVDDGTYGVVFTGAALQAFLELANPSSGMLYAAADAKGNLYFYENSTQGTVLYDRGRRFAVLASRAVKYEFNQMANPGTTGTGVGTYRMQTRTVTPTPGVDVVELMFASQESCVGGILVYYPGDFDRDGAITKADIDFFNAQLAISSTLTSGMDRTDPRYLDYLKADLNGSALFRSDKTGISNAPVTTKDQEILKQFMVDDDHDGDVDLQDFSHFNSCFNGPNMPPSDVNGCANMDFDFDGDVDLNDFNYLQGCFNGPNRPLACL